MKHVMYIVCFIGFAFNVCSCIMSYISFKQKKDEVFKFLFIILFCELLLYLLYYMNIYWPLADVNLGFVGGVIWNLIIYLFGAAVFFMLQRSFYRVISVRFTIKKRLFHGGVTFSMTAAFLLLVAAFGPGWRMYYVVPYHLTSLQFVVIGIMLIKYLHRISLGALKNTIKAWIVILGVITPLKIITESYPPWLAFVNDVFQIDWPFLGLILIASNVVMFRFLILQLAQPAPSSAPDLNAPLLDGHALTDREIEVAELLIERRSYREIGNTLFISLPTVKSHASHIYQKIGVCSRGELLEMAAGLKR